MSRTSHPARVLAARLVKAPKSIGLILDLEIDCDGVQTRKDFPIWISAKCATRVKPMLDALGITGPLTERHLQELPGRECIVRFTDGKPVWLVSAGWTEAEEQTNLLDQANEALFGKPGGKG